MRPTPYDTRLAASVRDALLSISTGLTRYPEFVPGTSSRTFNVIMSDVGQFLYLTGLLSRLSTEAPQVALRTFEMPAKAPHLILEAGEVDLAVGAFTKLIVGCRQRHLYREKYVCVARQDHPSFRRGMTAEAFCSVSHAMVDPRGHFHEHLDRLLSQQKVPRKIKLYVPYFMSLPQLIANSDLLVIMSGRMAEAFARMVPLKIMLPPAKLPTYNVSLFWHERFHRDPANRWLRGLYRSVRRPVGEKATRSGRSPERHALDRSGSREVDFSRTLPKRSRHFSRSETKPGTQRCAVDTTSIF